MHLVSKIAVLVLAGLAVAGCSATAEVQGQSADGTEIFSGTAQGKMDGSGVLQVRSNLGRSCTGNFVYETNRRGAGNFACTDGSSGPFEFTSTGSTGVGTGNIDGKVFTFTFG